MDLARKWLEAAGYLVVVARGGITPVAVARRVVPDVVILDLEMPDLTGL